LPKPLNGGGEGRQPINLWEVHPAGRNGRVWKVESNTGNYEHITDGNKPNFSQSQTSHVQLFLGHAWNMLEFAEWNLVVTAAAICKHQDLFCFTEFHCLALEQKPRCLQLAR